MRLLRAALFAALVASARDAGAHVLSDYEQESVRIGLKEAHRELDPEPEGKIVEAIDVVTLDVIEDRDPAPKFLNWFHVTTRKVVVDREVLVRPGDVYHADLVEESERNLRVRQLSVVLIVPTKSKVPGRVRLLVVTKDVWSLRINWEPVLVNGRLHSLFLQPSEENLFGRHKTLFANVVLLPATYSAGLGFKDTRIGGTRLQTTMNANVIWNCETNGVEGSYGTFAYGKPLYSARTRWAWGVSAEWNDSVVRPRGTVGQSICGGQRPVQVDLASTPQVESIPYHYHQGTLLGDIHLTRSFGVAIKHDVSFGVETTRRVYEPPSELAAETPAARTAFQRLLPVSDTRLSPFVQLHAHENRFLRALDLESLGLQEDFWLGHDVWLRAYPAARAVGSSRDLVGVWSGAGYTVPMGDGLARAYVSSTIEISDIEHSDAELGAGARVVSPRSPIGRVLVDGRVLDRVKNYLNPLVSLGGTTRLRGYRPSAFVGPNFVVTNVEFRSRPVELWSVQVGGALFYDVGRAFRDFGTLELRQGVGAGLRILFPQLERTVFRIDVGFPLDPEDPAAETSIVAQFKQAFDVANVARE